jgi:hypothetical protein
VEFHRLVPLRIPSGWEVRFNNLVELRSPTTLTEEERDAYLSQDLLLLRSTAPEPGPSAGFVLDVGWTPDGSLDGAYRLRVGREAGGEPQVRLDSVHVEIVRDAIELCLNRLNEGLSLERIQRLLDDATTVDGEKVD